MVRARRAGAALLVSAKQIALGESFPTGGTGGGLGGNGSGGGPGAGGGLGGDGLVGISAPLQNRFYCSGLP